MLIFEQTTSTLYYSNDGLLHVRRIKHPDDIALALPRWVFQIIECDEHTNPDYAEVVFSTYDSVKADAYIAGYDLATRV